MTVNRSPKKFTDAEKDEQARVCWQLSLDGHSQPVIAQTVGIGVATVWRRLNRYRQAVVMPDADYWRAKQIERMEDLITALKPHVSAGVLEIPYVMPYVKAVAQLDSYTGAALPVKTELTVTMQDSQDAELAELIAMSTAAARIQTPVQEEAEL